jgi:hypothetical protein
LPDDPPAARTPVGGEEVLEAGGRPGKSRTRRLREQLLLAAVILALVAAVARAMSHSGRPDSSPATPGSSLPAHRSAPDSGSGLLNGSLVDPSGPAAGTAQDPFACPATYQCLESAEAGAPAVAALHAAFPAAVLQSASTVRLLSPHVGPPLWFRELDARLGSTEILVRVHRPTAIASVRPAISRAAGAVVTYYQGRLATYDVDVQVTTQTNREQPLSPMQKLAADVRLLNLS